MNTLSTVEDASPFPNDSASLSSDGAGNDGGGKLRTTQTTAWVFRTASVPEFMLTIQKMPVVSPPTRI